MLATAPSQKPPPSQTHQTWNIKTNNLTFSQVLTRKSLEEVGVSTRKKRLRENHFWNKKQSRNRLNLIWNQETKQKRVLKAIYYFFKRGN